MGGETEGDFTDNSNVYLCSSLSLKTAGQYLICSSIMLLGAQCVYRACTSTIVQLLVFNVHWRENSQGGDIPKIPCVLSIQISYQCSNANSTLYIQVYVHIIPYSCNSKYKQSYLIHTQVAHIHASTYQLIGKRAGTFLYQDQSDIKNWTHQLFFTVVLVYVLCTSSQAIHVWTTAFFMKGAGLGMGLMHLCGYLLSWVHLIG